MQETNGFEYSRENFSDVRNDIEVLLEKHWEEIALNKSKIKLNPDWDTYLSLYEAGQLGIYTARKDKKLVGYFIVVAAPNPHYKDHIFAVNDIIYLDPEYRKGFVGVKLIKYAEKNLKELGVSVLAINTKVHKPFDSLMERLGFSLIERVYSKYIGE
jgi:GNAT superfamily N-acetyltransferase